MDRWVGGLILLTLLMACRDSIAPVDDDEAADVGVPDGSGAGDASAAPDATGLDMGDSADAAVEVECRVNSDCVAALGERGRCVGTAEGRPDARDPSDNRCQAVLDGVAYRLGRLEITRPVGAGALFQTHLNDWVESDQLNLTVAVERAVTFEPSADGFVPRYAGWIFNAADGRSTPTEPAPGHPATRADVQQTECQPGVTCLTLRGRSADEQVASDHLELWLPNPPSRAGCSVQQLLLSGSVRLEVGRDPATARMTLTGLLTRPRARRLMMLLPDRPLGSMAAILDESGIVPDTDTNADGALDAWTIELQGAATPVDVLETLPEAVGDTPCD